MSDPTRKPDPAASADPSDTCCACNRAANEHILSEFYETPPDAKKALHKGVQAILAEKGGFLCTPADETTACFVPRNREGHRVVPDPPRAG